MSLENRNLINQMENSPDTQRKRGRFNFGSRGLLFRLKTTLTRKLGGFDLDGSGSIDLSEYDAKRLAKANGLLDQPLTKLSLNTISGRPVSLDDLDSLVREQHWREEGATQNGPLDQYFSSLEVSRSIKVPAPELDKYWSENMGNSAMPEPRLGQVNLNSYQPSSKEKVASAQSAPLGNGTMAKKHKPKGVLAKLLDSLLEGLIGALLTFFGFNRSLNSLRSKKIAKIRKKAKK